MPPINLPEDIAFWPKEIIEEVAFMSTPAEQDDEMNTFEICAVIRYLHPPRRYINPSDVGTIAEWLIDPEPEYGGLKEETKTLIATLGESKLVAWRERVSETLRIAKEKGWDGFDMFEAEDPRRATSGNADADTVELTMNLDSIPSDGQRSSFMSVESATGLLLSGENRRSITLNTREVEQGKDSHQSLMSSQAESSQREDTIEKYRVHVAKVRACVDLPLYVIPEHRKWIRDSINELDRGILELNRRLSKLTAKGTESGKVIEGEEQDTTFRAEDSVPAGSSG